MRSVSLSVVAWCVLVARSSMCLAQQTPDVGSRDADASESVVQGNYVNTAYSYSVSVPDRLRAYRLNAPAPQHGITIHLDRGGEVWVNGEFDALLLGSTEALARHAADTLSKSHRLRIVRSSRTELSTLEARDVVLESEPGKGRINYVHFVLAFRSVPKGVGITYMIVLQERAKDVLGESVFSRVVKSFRLADLPD
jgi:hypothetical protein